MNNNKITFKIIVPSYNCQLWVEKTVETIKSQTYKNFECILIDDASTDDTFQLMKRYINGDRRFKVANNKTNKGALANIYHGIKATADNPEDVIVTLDGDDWFYSERSLQILYDVYQANKCLLTYGSFVDTTGSVTGHVNQNSYDISTINNNAFRDVEWKATALRTFKLKLWDSINYSDLIDPETNDFYKVTWDLAFMFPMLEMAGERIKHIKDILYVYNVDNPINDFKLSATWQLRLNKLIRNKTKYQKKIWT